MLYYKRPASSGRARGHQLDSKRFSSPTQAGAALLELAIVAPLMLTVILIVVDLGQVFIHFLKLSQVAYEGVRLASKLADIERPSSPANSAGKTCSTDGTAVCCSTGDPLCPATRTQHQVIMNRIQALLLLESFSTMTPNPWTITFTYSPTDPGITSTTEDSVQVTIQLRYRTFFSAMGLEFPVRVTAIAPYMYQ